MLLIIIIGSLAQLNRASDYGSEGYRFESCANHKKNNLVYIDKVILFLFLAKIYSPDVLQYDRLANDL